MGERAPLPFHSFSFTLVDERRPRALLRMTAVEGGMYELHVEKGSAANPTSQFTREVPCEVAQRLKDSLQDIGVFGWSESYGNAEGLPGRRWTLHTVFKQDVFEVCSKGGSEVPAGFEKMLEELYRLDFPRPAEPTRTDAPKGMGGIIGASGMRGIGALSAGDLGAYSATGFSGAGGLGAGGLGGLGGLDGLGGLGGLGGSGGAGVDFSQLAEMMGGDGIPGMDASELGDLFAQVGRDPQALQQRMRDEFRHMSPDEQDRMLDALASMGMASRAWWERFLRG